VNQNQSPAINPFSQKIIAATRLVIDFGLPIFYFLIAVAFYLVTYDSAQIKITLTEIGGAVLLGAWLIKIIEEDPLEFFKKNFVLIAPLLAFLASGIISHLHSSFPLASSNELIRRVIYISIALIVIKEFDSIEKFNRLLGWLIAATFVVTIYGVIQYLDYRYFPGPPEPGLDPFIWRQAFGSRVFSTFGNPNFYGDFLVVMSPIVLALCLRDFNPKALGKWLKKNFLLIILWLLIVFNVINTYSKGAWFGFGAGLVIFVFIAIGFFLKAHGKLKRVLLIAMAAAIIIVGSGIGRETKNRTDSASFRIFTWLSTWEMINTHPWLGTGIGTYYITYPSWRRPQIFFIEGRHNTETDHPENEYLEVWYDEGFVGFGIFLLVLAGFLMVSFKNLQVFTKRNNENPQGDIRAYFQFGILAAILAQLSHNMMCVSLRFVSSGVVLWLMVGLAGALNANHPLPLKSPENFKPGRLPEPIRRLLQLIVVAATCYAVYIFYGYFDADVHHNRAIYFSKGGDWIGALSHYDQVIKENPSFIMAHYFEGNVYNDRWSEGDPQRAIDKYKDVWKLAPNYVQSHHQAGLIYLKWGEDLKNKAAQALAKGDKRSAAAFDKEKLEVWQKAMQQFELYREIDPIFPLNYYRMAWLDIQQNKMKEAEAVYRAHIEYPESLKLAPHNAWVEDWSKRRKPEYSETYTNLGNLSFMQNDFKGAEESYKKAVELNPESVNAMKNLAVVYSKLGDFENAKTVWEKLRVMAPNDADVQKMFQPR
jgi:tetratricopeptide (TPR) repeat protein